MPDDFPTRGLFCALSTPLDGDGRIDGDAFRAHAARLLAEGCDGIAPFGTTGEGPSFSAAERKAGLEALLQQGIATSRIVAGAGAAAASDAIDLGRHALSLGVTRLLMLPPFYFKDLTDEELYGAYARIIDGIRDARLRLVLYHIPQVTQVPLTQGAIARLRAGYQTIVAGIKDSTGDIDHTLRLIRRFPDIRVFCGAEQHLPAVLQAGGAGTICGLANLIPRRMRRLRDAKPDEAQALVPGIAMLAGAVCDGPFVPRLKALLAVTAGDDWWRNACPPYLPLSAAETSALLRRVTGAGVLEEDWPSLLQPAAQ